MSKPTLLTEELTVRISGTKPETVAPSFGALKVIVGRDVPLDVVL